MRGEVMSGGGFEAGPESMRGGRGIHIRHPTSHIRHRRAFTLVELLVVAGMVVVLVAVFVPYVMSVREGRNRVVCADQLRQIKAWLQAYAETNAQSLPRVVFDPERAADPQWGSGGWVAFTGADAADPFAEGMGGAGGAGAQAGSASPDAASGASAAGEGGGGASQLATAAAPGGGFNPQLSGPSQLATAAARGGGSNSQLSGGGGVRVNDVSASVWLLVRTVGAEPRGFVCPSTSDRADVLTDASGQKVEATRRGNFRGPGNLSYAYANPFTANYRTWDRLPVYYPLMADRPPTGPEAQKGLSPKDSALTLARGNSGNHGRAGQNVLYAYGGVEFMTTPFSGDGWDWKAGTTGENIYAGGDGGEAGAWLVPGR